MLEYKGIPYKLTNLLPVVSWGVLRRVRQIFLCVMGRKTASLGTFLEGSKIGLPHGLAVRTAGPFIALDGRSHSAGDANVRTAIALLPEMLQRIDDWIAEGVLGGQELNAADF
jgi:hypothetical protein